MDNAVNFIVGGFFCIVLFAIIVFALKVMYKDVNRSPVPKKGGHRPPQQRSVNYGLEVIKCGSAQSLKEGAIIPIRSDITIGRKDNNTIVVPDSHVSGQHARIVLRNNSLFLEDLNSTNGTYVNGSRINGRAKLFGKDQIKIGACLFKILT